MTQILGQPGQRGLEISQTLSTRYQNIASRVLDKGTTQIYPVDWSLKGSSGFSRLGRPSLLKSQVIPAFCFYRFTQTLWGNSNLPLKPVLSPQLMPAEIILNKHTECGHWISGAVPTLVAVISTEEGKPLEESKPVPRSLNGLAQDELPLSSAPPIRNQGTRGQNHRRTRIHLGHQTLLLAPCGSAPWWVIETTLAGDALWSLLYLQQIKRTWRISKAVTPQTGVSSLLLSFLLTQSFKIPV